jgi:UDP-N-acetylglucosamine diphosphorylase/glucosamine-1-phosphate N-acetyltransferase
MNLILFDQEDIRSNLLPFTFTRPVGDIRIGILTIREKWEKRLKTTSSSLTTDYLQKKHPLHEEKKGKDYWINGSICPNSALIKALKALAPEQALVKDSQVIAFHPGTRSVPKKGKELEAFALSLTKIQVKGDFIQVSQPWDIFKRNGEAISEDYDFLTKGRKSQALSKTNRVLGKAIFLEKGAKAECCTFNSTTGPIYIGKNAEIMEGSLVRGPFSIGEESVLKLGTKVYGPTTLGPYSKAGGELSNSVIFGYTNKAHDGFLGNSVLGEWCNLGADTNNSNLKNNYGEVKLYNYPKAAQQGTGLQFCGLMMGDHAKSGINTMFNTGTVVGVASNVFGGGFPPTFIPDFSWGGAPGMEEFRLDKALALAGKVYERRGLVLGETDKEILKEVFLRTQKLRRK